MAVSTFQGTHQHFHILKQLGILVLHCVKNVSIKLDYKKVLKILYLCILGMAS